MIRFIINIFIFLIIIISPLHTLYATSDDPKSGIYDGRIRIINGDKYFNAVREEIKRAKQSIYIAMYLMISTEKEQNPVAMLVDELIKAHKRGVEVKVILEDGFFWVCHKAYKRLLDEGIWIRLDNPYKILHSKVVVIDNKICIIGSTNWTKSAFFKNHESSVLIESKDMARVYIEDFNKIELREGAIEPVVEGEGIRLPSILLTSPDKLAKLFIAHANGAFDIYFIFRRISETIDSDIIPLDYGYLSEEIDSMMPEGRDLNGLRYNPSIISRFIRNLDKKYGLVRHIPYDKNLKIVDMPNKDDYFILPLEYFEYGLDKRLSLGAKFAYLISLLEVKKSQTNPCWSLSQANLSVKYHVSRRRLGDAISELEKENILEVYRHIPMDMDNFAKRPANRYCLNPLISEDEFKARVKVLSDKYGRDIIDRAVEFSTKLNEPKDLKDIETFINLIEEYGYEGVKHAVKETSDYKLSSGLRDISIVIKKLKGK